MMSAGTVMMNANHALRGTLLRVPPPVLALSEQGRLLALGAAGALMLGLASLGLWLIRLALRPR